GDLTEVGLPVAVRRDRAGYSARRGDRERDRLRADRAAGWAHGVARRNRPAVGPLRHGRGVPGPVDALALAGAGGDDAACRVSDRHGPGKRLAQAGLEAHLAADRAAHGGRVELRKPGVRGLTRDG